MNNYFSLEEGRKMSSKEKMTMQGEYDNYDYRTSAEMTLDEQIDSTRQALASAICLLKDNESDYLKNKVKEIDYRLQQLENIKSFLSKYDSYEVIDPDDVNTEEVIRFFYSTVRDNLLVRGLNRKEVLLLLEEYRLKERLVKMTVEQLQDTFEKMADEIFAIKDSIICNECHEGKIEVFEDRGGYSVRCDCCNKTNHCRCETKEMAINFWIKGIYRL